MQEQFLEFCITDSFIGNLRILCIVLKSLAATNHFVYSRPELFVIAIMSDAE